MARHEVLAMMTALKLAGMRAAYDDILADGLKRRHPVRADHWYAAADRGRRQAGALHQVPDDVRQAADGQGAGRLRLRHLTGQRAPDPGARRQVPSWRASATSCWSAAPAPGKTHLAVAIARVLHPKGRPRPVLQRRRPGQPPRGRTPRRTPGPHRRPARPPRLRHPRRTRLPALRPGRRAAALPPDEPALRATPRSSSPPTSPSANGPPSSATPR